MIHFLATKDNIIDKIKKTLINKHSTVIYIYTMFNTG